MFAITLLHVLIHVYQYTYRGTNKFVKSYHTCFDKICHNNSTTWKHTHSATGESFTNVTTNVLLCFIQFSRPSVSFCFTPRCCCCCFETTSPWKLLLSRLGRDTAYYRCENPTGQRTPRVTNQFKVINTESADRNLGDSETMQTVVVSRTNIFIGGRRHGTRCERRPAAEGATEFQSILLRPTFINARRSGEKREEAVIVPRGLGQIEVHLIYLQQRTMTTILTVCFTTIFAR